MTQTTQNTGGAMSHPAVQLRRFYALAAVRKGPDHEMCKICGSSGPVGVVAWHSSACPFWTKQMPTAREAQICDAAPGVYQFEHDPLTRIEALTAERDELRRACDALANKAARRRRKLNKYIKRAQQAEAQVAHWCEITKGLQRISSWGHIRDANTDGLPVTITIEYPQDKQTFNWNAKDLRLIGDSGDNLPTSASALLARMERQREALEALFDAPLRYNDNRIEIDCADHADAMRRVANARATLAEDK